MKRKGFCLLMALALLASQMLPAFAEEAEEAEPQYKEITLSTAEDVQKLAKLDIHGAIIGKAYYTGAVDLKEAIGVAK